MDTQPSSPTRRRRSGRRTDSRSGRGPVPPAVTALLERLDEVSLADAASLRRRLRKARSDSAIAAITADVDKAAARLAARREHPIEVTYPEGLPVSARRDDIMAAIAAHQVVVIAGETGSGKTTQLPKMCLDLGRGVRGLIGHTQPRRLAARTVAERVAEELSTTIGDTVGYAIRFNDRVSPRTQIKLMTDGILLNEMQRDRLLLRYDTIIIDEAHERSLNIDFLLGYLKQLLPQRPDLKVIITSATIDPERFATHFAAPDGTPAPIIEVSGRTFPVEIRYRPLVAEQGEKLVDIDPIDGLLDAVDELLTVGPGDILVFCSGEREIRDARDALDKRRLKGVEVLPLFGRLSNEEQHRVFSPTTARRRIVLATNIAETSLTVPGIRYVIDLGEARIGRYSTRTKVQRLPIEPISQASAAQRSGRCGRVADGVAIRLYSEEDFASRPEFTDPEILRTNLAQVILQMAHLKLGEINDFPFIDPPDKKAIRDGIAVLHELGALDNPQQESGFHLTPLGAQIAQLPVDPRMAVMLAAAHTNGALAEVITIVAALSIQDVRERPQDKQTQASQSHARFAVPGSDFLTRLKLWDYLVEQRQELSASKFRKLCLAEYLHYVRIREWDDLQRQLESLTERLGWVPNTHPASADNVHLSLLAGLLGHIGLREGESTEFLGARGARFRIFPSSVAHKKPSRFVMANELVETSRLFARDIAGIDPIWVEKLGPHLVRYSYSDPHWSAKRGGAMVAEKASLYGVPLVADRIVPYHKVDAEAARDMFIRHALVGGEWTTHHDFFHHNRALLEDVAELEHKARRRDITVDDEVLFAFYDERLPDEATTAAHFDRWWKKTKATQPQLLTFDPRRLVNPDAEVVEADDFPDLMQHQGRVYDLTYNFEPGTADDGVTVRVPIPALATITEQGFDWLVPGLRVELATALIKTLPKNLRRGVVPAPDHAQRAVAELHYDPSLSFRRALATQLSAQSGMMIGPEHFQPAALPDHLRVSFAAVDKRGRILDRDRDLAALKKRNSGRVGQAVATVSAGVERDAATVWTSETLGTIEPSIVRTVDGQKVTAYPALVPAGEEVAVKVLPTEAEATAAMAAGTLTLLLARLPKVTKQLLNGLPLQQRVAVQNYPHGKMDGLLHDARVAATKHLLEVNGGPVRDPESFAALADAIASALPGTVRQLIVSVAPALVDYLSLAEDLSSLKGESGDDMRAQLDDLFCPGMLSFWGPRVQRFPRYLAAVRIRMEQRHAQPQRDLELMDSVLAVVDTLNDKLAGLPAGRAHSKEVKDIYIQIEELRVSVFAQQLGTQGSISPQRITKAIAKLR